MTMTFHRKNQQRNENDWNCFEFDHASFDKFFCRLAGQMKKNSAGEVQIDLEVNNLYGLENRARISGR